MNGAMMFGGKWAEVAKAQRQCVDLGIEHRDWLMLDNYDWVPRQRAQWLYERYVGQDFDSAVKEHLIGSIVQAAIAQPHAD